MGREKATPVQKVVTEWETRDGDGRIRDGRGMVTTTWVTHTKRGTQVTARYRKTLLKRLKEAEAAEEVSA